MTMDYYTEREIWLFLKGNFISETGEAMPTKIGVHALNINLYLHEFFEPIQKKPCPPKLACMHITLIPTCIYFLSRF